MQTPVLASAVAPTAPAMAAPAPAVTATPAAAVRCHLVSWFGLAWAPYLVLTIFSHIPQRAFHRTATYYLAAPDPTQQSPPRFNVCDDYPPLSTDPCAGIDCGSHGFCSSGTCTCSGGYTGNRCQTAPGKHTYIQESNAVVTSRPGRPLTCVAIAFGTLSYHLSSDPHALYCCTPCEFWLRLISLAAPCLDRPVCGPGHQCGANGSCSPSTGTCTCQGGHTGNRCQTAPGGSAHPAPSACTL